MSAKTRRPGELPPLPKAAASSSPTADPVIGTVIGERYKILERIGSGGMASVYRAEHQSLKKPVAVKLLLPELAVEQDMVGRFEREAVAAARLDHPNCVSIIDFGRMPGGRLYIVMEYLEGVPLSEVAGYGKRLPWERAVEITRQILRGLARAHETGIVHRDLKPSNIMITPLGGQRDLAKIIDFGIAKLFDGSQAGPHVETKAGIVFGTADFLAPERLVGKGDTDPRSDLYSVAVLLYEMVCGERPFHDEDPYVIVKRALAEKPRPPSAIAPDAGLPAALEEVILHGMEKEPEKRYATAREFLNALDPIGKRAGGTTDYLAGRPSSGIASTGAISSTPVSAVAGARRSLLPVEPRARRRAILFLSAGGVLLLLIPLVIVALTTGGSHGKHAGLSPGPAAHPPASAAATGAAEVDRLVAQAGEGETIEVRHSAFDRLVALGYRDRVPWLAMLSRDLEQHQTCEKRLGVVTQLRNLGDPRAIPLLEQAMKRPGNDCLLGSAKTAIAHLGGSTPDEASSGATRTDPDSETTKTTTQTRRKSSGGSGRSSGGGGHF
jgi:serine/threonine-protein kinase